MLTLKRSNSLNGVITTDFRDLRVFPHEYNPSWRSIETDYFLSDILIVIQIIRQVLEQDSAIEWQFFEECAKFGFIYFKNNVMNDFIINIYYDENRNNKINITFATIKSHSVLKETKTDIQHSICKALIGDNYIISEKKNKKPPKPLELSKYYQLNGSVKQEFLDTIDRTISTGNDPDIFIRLKSIQMFTYVEKTPEVTYLDYNYIDYIGKYLLKLAVDKFPSIRMYTLNCILTLIKYNNFQIWFSSNEAIHTFLDVLFMKPDYFEIYGSWVPNDYEGPSYGCYCCDYKSTHDRKIAANILLYYIQSSYSKHVKESIYMYKENIIEFLQDNMNITPNLGLWMKMTEIANMI